MAAVAISLLVLSGLFYERDSRPIFVVYGVGQADSCGNFIREFRIQQYNGSSWVTMYTITNTTYSSGMELRLNDGENTRFYINVWFNKSLATSTDEAKTFIKVNMTIPGVWTDQSLVGEDYGELQYVGDDGAFWIFESGVYTEWSDGPETDETYESTAKYQVYR